MKEFVKLLRGIIILIFVFVPFLSCDGQVRVNGNLKENGGWKFEVAELEERIDSLQIVLESSKSKIAGLEKSVDEKTNELEALALDIANRTQEVDNLTNQLTSAESNISTLQNKITVLEATILSHIEDKNSMQNEIDLLKSEKATAESQIVSLNTVIIEKENELSEWKTKYEDLLANPNIVHDTIYLVKTEIPAKVIDTFVTISDPILLDFTDSLVKPIDPADVYVMVTGIGLVHLQEMDTVYRFQTMFEIESTIDYSKTKEDQIVTYRNLGLPFQFRNKESYITTQTENSITVRVFTTENCEVQMSANNVINADASEKGFNATKVEDLKYRHTRTLTGLEPSTRYKIQVVATTEDGRLDLWTVYVSTL